MQLAGVEWAEYIRKIRKRNHKFGINRYGSIHMPRMFVLPGPYIITTARLRPMEMKEKYGECYDAMWDRETQHIDFNYSCKVQRKWWLFGQILRDDIVAAWMEWMEAKGIANQAGKRPPGKSPTYRQPYSYRPPRKKGKFISPQAPAARTD